MNNSIRAFIFNIWANNNKFTGEVIEVPEDLDDNLFNGVLDYSRGLFFTIAPLPKDFDETKHTAHYQVETQEWVLQNLKLSGEFYEKATGKKFEEIDAKDIDQYTTIPTPKTWSFGDICVFNDEQQSWSYQSASKETISFFKYNAKKKTTEILDAILKNEINVLAIVAIGNLKKQIKIKSDLDTLSRVAYDGANNVEVFSFVDTEDIVKRKYLFSNIAKSVAVEILSAISNFKRSRGKSLLEYDSLIESADSIDEIDEIVSNFADIEKDGENGWFLKGGSLSFTLSQEIKQLKVSQFVKGKEIDITEAFISAQPDF